MVSRHIYVYYMQMDHVMVGGGSKRITHHVLWYGNTLNIRTTIIVYSDMHATPEGERGV